MDSVCYRVLCKRLARFEPIGEHKALWERRWSGIEDLKEFLERPPAKHLGELGDVFASYLPRNARVLEAGCGVGQLVLSLTRLGYRMEGVDYAVHTVARTRMLAPDLALRVADVNHLDVPDGTYGGYISIGVFEHDPSGPMQGLLETRRVLRPGGVALIAVPYLNPERARWLSELPTADNTELEDGFRFYQYYFSRDEFAGFVRQAGFEVLQVHPYGVYAGLTRDFPIGRWLDSRGFFAWRFHRGLSAWCADAPAWARWRWAHMLVFACQRVD